MDTLLYHQRGKDPFYQVWHTSGVNMLILMHSDGGSIVCSEKNYPIQKGALCFIGSEKYHYTLPDDPEHYERTKIFLTQEQLQPLLHLWPDQTLFQPDSAVYAHLSDADLLTAEQCLADAAQHSHSAPVIYSCFLRLLTMVERSSQPCLPSPPGPVHQAIEYINAHIQDPLSIDTICQAVHVSKYHFCRQFHQVTGQTVMECVLQTRLMLARSLLLKTRLTACEISERCGFSSQAYFCRAFHRHTGLTPLQYRHRRT